jgi:uncharacterized cupredoxin-like copper-binding protein
MNLRTSLILPAAAVGAGLLVAGCGSSSSQDDAKAPAKTPAAEASTRPVATSAAGASSAKLDATSGKVTVDSTEWAFSAPEIDAKAGKLKLTLDNKGKIEHELVLLKSADAPASLKIGGQGRVSEKASVGEVSETKPGVSRSTTFDLKPGRYVYVCNIPGHYASGMRGVLVVK